MLLNDGVGFLLKKCAVVFEGQKANENILLEEVTHSFEHQTKFGKGLQQIK